ncbi:MAG: MFS transporter [Flavobacteriales bacterium]|tara:strand:+ start:849 stop:2177 length:1329 start_codon:yes stop_codon:yes gene_type:complete
MLELKIPLEKGSKKIINAWAFYDWANSVYPLVISSAIFPIYYASLFSEDNFISFFQFEVKNTAMISFVTAAAFFIVALMSPLLTGIADYIGNKKRFMKIFVYLGAFSCIGLYFFELKTIYLGLFIHFLGLIGYSSSIVFYNSYLPDIAFPDQQDRVSARGFSIGYVGSVILLLSNLAMIMYPDIFGIEGNKVEASIKAMRYSFISAGIWWILFSQYSFYFLPKGNREVKVTKDIFWNGYKELKSVWKLLEDNIALKRFLPAFYIYSMALQTVLLVAVYFGEEEILWGSSSEKTMGLIVSILLIQIVGILGAFLTAMASERFGNIRALIVVNSIWATLCCYAYYIETPMQFYFVAGSVGLVMGGLQALSRSTYSKLIPITEDTASFFSFYDVTEKIAIIVGMSLFGVIDQITGSMRNAILFFMTFFIIGAVMLLRVPRKKLRS